MPSDEVHLRTAVPEDAEALAQGVLDGLEDYPSFAPPDWTAPAFEAEVAHLRARLAAGRAHCLVAERDGRVVGQVSILDAAAAPDPVEEPGLAHLSDLFVAREMWGAGLARRLHAAALDAARERGFTAVRLFVATGQARAVRFYEREGWTLTGAPFAHPDLRLEMAEYRHPL